MLIRIIQPSSRSGVTTLELNPVKTEVAHLDAMPVLEWLFRQFNAVDGTELFSVLPVAMPSLSVGDVVEISDGSLSAVGSERREPSRRFRCEGFGWKEIL
jgi:hypothetical protein